MLISNINRNTEKRIYSQNQSIMEAEELLYNVVDASLSAAGDNLEIEENEHRKGLHTLYYECIERLERINKIGPKADFLSMAALENMFRSALPLLLVSLQELLEGNSKVLQDAGKLLKVFADNPYKQIWKQKNDAYVSMLSTLGIALHNPSISFNQMVDPLLDAFGFYTQKINLRSVFRVRDGRKDTSRPAVASKICKYTSEKEFVTAIQNCGQESALIFGAVEKTFQHTTDFFDEWYYGHPSERMSNWMKHDKLSRKEYLNAVDKYSRIIYLGVKSAETIWLVRMPYKTESYGGTYDDCSAKFVYGNRAGYAPYEVFFKETSPAPEGTHFISLLSGGWALDDVMDDEAKVWLPAFLEETVEYFFKTEMAGVKSTELILPEEMAASYLADGKKMRVCPVSSGVPSLVTFDYQIPSPETLFDEDYMPELLQYFDVKPSDIDDAPILPYECSSLEETQDNSEKKARSAYLKVLADKIADFLYENIAPAKGKILDYISQNEERILENALKGHYSEFGTVLIDGTVERDSEGKEIFVKSSIYPYQEKTSVLHTKRDDGKIRLLYEMINQPDLPYVIWKGGAKDTNPPVVWKFRFDSLKGYARLFETRGDQLEDIFRLSDLLRRFWTDYNRVLPSNLVCLYPYWYEKKTRSVYFPDLARVNICMTKREYKQVIKNLKGLR